MIGANDGTLKQAPNALNAVSVNITDNPLFLRVINPLVFGVGIFNSPIRGRSVGVRRCVVVDELMQHG